MGKVLELLVQPTERRRDTVYFNGKSYTYEPAENAVETEPSSLLLKSIITKQFCLKLYDKGYRFKGKYLAFKKEDRINQPHDDIFSIFDGFRFRTVLLFERLFLCIDPHLVIWSQASVEYLLKQGCNPSQLADFSVSYRGPEGRKIDGYLVRTASANNFEGHLGEGFLCQVKNHRNFKEELLSPSVVYPESRLELMQTLLDVLNRKFNVISLQRQHSFLNTKTASLERLKKTLTIVARLQEIFPLEFGGFKVTLENEPVRIKW